MPTAPITFTLDLEDHRPSAAAPVRFPAVTRRVLDALDEHRVRGTVFVVGEVAEQEPGLVRDVAARGHEVALHGWRHVPLTEVEPTRLRDELRRGKALLEDLTGREVVGFRAPMFSLVPESRAATELLAEAGFAYSSSVLPARNPLFGDPAAPARPFRWASGVLELPCPVARVGPVALPFLGGVYLRSLPWPVVRAGLAAVADRQLLWVYCHPYDFDPGEERWLVPEAGRLGSRLLWLNRDGALAKVLRLLGRGAAPPLAERAAAITATGPGPGPGPRPEGVVAA